MPDACEARPPTNADLGALESACRSTSGHGRRHFIATVAHELRGPVAAVQNAIDLLARPDLARPIHDQAIGIARRQLKQAAQLVDDLFDLARLGESKLRLKREHVRLRDIVRTAMEVSRPAMAAGRIIVELTIEPPKLA
jgi:signal transduction histidine kinase